MKFKIFAASLLSLAVATPASAQTASEDMRCFILSNVFAKTDKDEKLRVIAAQSTMFYLGRLDGRAAPGAIIAGLRTRIDPKTAGPLMTACAQHLERARQAMQAAFQTLAQPSKH